MRKNRRDGLYRRNKGLFAFRYKVDGTWHEKSTATANRDDAVKVRRDFLNNVAEGLLPTDKAGWTVEQACTRWVEQHAAHLTSGKAKSNEQSYLRQLVCRLGSLKLKAIGLDTLKDYQTARRRKVREGAINKELRILVSTMREANLWTRHLEDNYKRLTEPESDLGRALSMEELMRLETAAASNPAWEVALCAQQLAANTGLRGCEIKRLRIGNVDLENRRLEVTREGTKTNAGARRVELNQVALSAVSKLYQRAQLLGVSAPEHYLLPGDLSRHTKTTDPLRGGRGFDPTRHQESWATAWGSLRIAAGLEGVGFHCMRHSFVTMLGEQGTPLPVTMSLVGHMSARMTRHYTHISANAARTAVEKLDRIRSGFVDDFVDDSRSASDGAPKMLN